MLNQKEFQKSRLRLKISLLQKDGTYVAKRYYLRYEVLLYSYNDFFVEVWRTLSFEEIYSIDVAPKRSVKEAYLNNIDLKELGLDL